MAFSAMQALRSSASPQLISKLRVLPYRSFSTAVNAEDETDYFAIFQLPRSFAIENAELKNSYRKLMNTFHPDKHSSGSSEAKEDAEEHAAAITAAYDALKHPHTRATHLLSILGKPLDETANSMLVGNQFLMEILEIRESVDTASGDEVLRPLLDAYREKQSETIRFLEGAFESGDLDQALELTAQLQYWNRIEETLVEKIENYYD